jgi:hypothetical protein
MLILALVEDRPDHWRVVILSDALWRRRFGADPEVVGRPITMNDRRYAVIGVLPADFEPVMPSHFYEPAELWAPLGYDALLPYACRTCQHLGMIGRLEPSVEAERAQVEINTIQRHLRVEHPNEYGGGRWRTIVAVVGDVHHEELPRPASMQFCVPESQFVDSSRRSSSVEPSAGPVSSPPFAWPFGTRHRAFRSTRRRRSTISCGGRARRAGSSCRSWRCLRRWPPHWPHSVSTASWPASWPSGDRRSASASRPAWSELPRTRFRRCARQGSALDHASGGVSRGSVTNRRRPS